MAYLSILGPGKLSANLLKSEIRAASHQGVTSINENVVGVFELVRKYSGGKPAKVSSAGRRHRVDGDVSDSAHFDDDALDIKLSPDQLATLKANLQIFLKEGISLYGLGGFGVYSNRVHVDVQREKVKNYWGLLDGNGVYLIRHWNKTSNPWLIMSNDTPDDPKPVQYDYSDVEAESDEKEQTTTFFKSPFVWIALAVFLVFGFFFIRKRVMK